MRAVIFDCDGVLVDSEAILVDLELEFLSGSGLEFDRGEYVRRFTGTSLASWKIAVSSLITKSGGTAPSDQDFRQLEKKADQELKHSLTEVAGAGSFLARLPNPRCVASSSTPEQLGWKLSATGLDGYFGRQVFSSSQVKHGKPAPDLFLYAAAQLNVAPADCVVLEDSSSGIRAAKRAGMTAIGLVAASHCVPEHRETLLNDGADFVAGDYADIDEWLSNWN